MHFPRLTQIILPTLLAAITAIGPGCNSSGPTVEPAYNFDGHATIQETPASSPAAANAPAASSGNPRALAIGAVLPLQGIGATLGRSLRRGLELGAAEVNADGGVNGQPLDLSVLDSQSDSAEGLRDVEKLAEGKISVLLIGDNSLIATSAEQLAGYPQLLGFLSDFVGVPTLTPKNGIRVFLNGDQEARIIADYISAAGVDKAAIIHVGTPLGQSHAKYMDYLLQGDHVSTYQDAYSTGERNFQPLARVMQRVQNGALIMLGDGPEYASLLGAFDASGWKGLALGYVSSGNLSALGHDGLAASAIYPVPDFALNPLGTEAGRIFAIKYRAKYNADPDLPAAYAYDNIFVLKAAATQAGSFDPGKMREAFLSLKTFIGAAGRYEIKHDGDTEMPLRLVTANGQPATLPIKAATPANITNVPSTGTPALPTLYESYPYPGTPAPAPAGGKP